MQSGGGGTGDTALAQLIQEHRGAIARDFIVRARNYGAAQSLPDEDVLDNLEGFLDELATAVAAGEPPSGTSAAAAAHGEQRFRLGYDLASVMREYSAVREALARVIAANEDRVSIQGTLTLFASVVLGMADSASRYTALHEMRMEAQTSEHIAFLAHELRNPLSSAAMALALMRDKGELLASRTAAALERGILRTLRLVDDSLVTVKLRALGRLDRRPIDVSAFLEDIVADSMFDADAKGIVFTASGEGRAVVDVKALRSAVSNLVRNAVKFTKPGGAVPLRRGGRGRVRWHRRGADRQALRPLRPGRTGSVRVRSRPRDRAAGGERPRRAGARPRPPAPRLRLHARPPAGARAAAPFLGDEALSCGVGGSC